MPHTGLLIDLLLFKGEGGIVGTQFFHQLVFGAVVDASSLQELLGNGDLLGDVVDLVLAADIVGLHTLHQPNKHLLDWGDG